MWNSKSNGLEHIPSKKCERRSLLPVGKPNGNAILESSVSSADDEDDDDGYSKRSSSVKVKLLPSVSGSNGNGNGHRHQIHRGVRRLARLVLCSLVVPILLLFFYLNIYSSATSRRCSLAEWGYNTSRNVAEYILPGNNTTLLEPRSICRDKIFLLIVVCSSVDNFAARQNIRDTWGNTTEFNYHMFTQLHSHMQEQYLEPSPQRIELYKDFIMDNRSKISNNDFNFTATTTIPVRVVFLIGRRKYESMLGNETLARLHSEAEQYDDIIQEDFTDTYNNLTIKSVMVLKWVTQRCLHSSAFVMKCDDDTFVNIPNLLHYLLGGTIPLYNDTLDSHDRSSYQVLANYNRLNSTRNFMMGHLFCGVHPIADVTSKWYMPYYMFPGDTYPNYLSGASYVMSTDVVPRLYETSLNTTLIYLEDIYITGICAERIHLKRRHNPLFSFKHSKAPCSFKGTITQHYMKNDAMLEMYAFVSNVSIKCPPPGKYFKTMRLRKTNSCT